MCTQQRHDLMKAKRAVYLATTKFHYWQPVDDGPDIEFRGCLLCNSSLADGTRREHVVEMRRAA